MLSVVKMPLKGVVVDRALNSHGNYIGDNGKSWKNHGNVFLNICGDPKNVHFGGQLVFEILGHLWQLGQNTDFSYLLHTSDGHSTQ